MDEKAIQQNYRQSQLDNLNTNFNKLYPTRIKIVQVGQETKWLDIEDSEFAAIKKILLNGEIGCGCTCDCNEPFDARP